MKRILRVLSMMLIVLLCSVGTVHAAAPVIPGGSAVLPSVLPDNLDELQVNQEVLRKAALPAAPPAANTPSLNGWSSSDGEVFWDNTVNGGGVALNIYLSIDGVPGESVDDRNRNQITLYSYFFGADKSSSSAYSSNNDGFKVLRVFKLMDKSSPRLLQAMMDNSNLQTITIEVRKAAGDQRVIWKLELDNAVVASFKQAIGCQGNIEEVCFNYTGAKLTYFYRNASGSESEDIIMEWD